MLPTTAHGHIIWTQVKLGLYTILHEHTAGLTATEIAQQLLLNTQPGFRGVKDWLDVLVTLDTLQRAGKRSTPSIAQASLVALKHPSTWVHPMCQYMCGVHCCTPYDKFQESPRDLTRRCVPHAAGDGADARYANSADAGRYLAKQSPDYMGGHAILYNDRCAAWFDVGQQTCLAGLHAPQLSAVCQPTHEPYVQRPVDAAGACLCLFKL